MKLEISHLRKSFGDVQALDNVELILEDGICGLLGPNGAGKSTLMNILTGNLKADEGSVRLDGRTLEELGDVYKHQLGYMPQADTLYPFFTGMQFMEYIAVMKEMEPRRAGREIKKLLKAVDLWDVRHKKINGYSGGMKRRLMLAQALLNDPKILILDEPTAGMDPQQRAAVRNLIGKIALSHIVILSTHVVSDIEYIAEDIVMMEHGKILYQKPPYALREMVRGKVHSMYVPYDKTDLVRKYGTITAISREEKDALVRVVGDVPVPEGAVEEDPTLDDVCQYLFHEENV